MIHLLKLSIWLLPLITLVTSHPLDAATSVQSTKFHDSDFFNKLVEFKSETKGNRNFSKTEDLETAQEGIYTSAIAKSIKISGVYNGTYKERFSESKIVNETKENDVAVWESDEKTSNITKDESVVAKAAASRESLLYKIENSSGNAKAVGFNITSSKESQDNDTKTTESEHIVEAQFFKKKPEPEPVETGKKFHVGTGLYFDVNLKKLENEKKPEDTDDDDDCNEGFWFWPFSVNDTSLDRSNEKVKIASTILLTKADENTHNLFTFEQQKQVFQNKTVKPTNKNAGPSKADFFEYPVTEHSSIASIARTNMILVLLVGGILANSMV